MNGLITGRNEAVGAQGQSQRLIAAATTLTPEDRVVLVDLSQTFTVTLCPVSECAGAQVLIVGIGSGGAVTVATPTGGMAVKITVDDLTVAGDFKLFQNAHGVAWIEIGEQTT